MSFVKFEYGKTNVISGSDACAIGAKLCRPDVIPMYPITPQTIVAERLAEFVADGELNSEIILVESEHSACSALMGAEATGTRIFTTTDSQGLALMNEVLFIVSGLRLPCVMGIANRALSAPINIWCDEQDSVFRLRCVGVRARGVLVELSKIPAPVLLRLRVDARSLRAVRGGIGQRRGPARAESDNHDLRDPDSSAA